MDSTHVVSVPTSLCNWRHSLSLEHIKTLCHSRYPYSMPQIVHLKKITIAPHWEDSICNHKLVKGSYTETSNRKTGM